jgi:hypothetical protein
MTEHLLECQPESVPDPPFICICPELRACEDRVARAFLPPGIIPEAGNGILAEGMSVAYNISTGRWTAGWLAKQLLLIDPDSPMGMSQDGKFLIALRPE